jgi:hypothetical protein
MEGRWLYGGVGRFLYLAMLADVSSGVSLLLVPLAVATFIRQLRRGKTLKGEANGG